MNSESKHDDLLMTVLREEAQILPFLDAVFGFLFRRTDFYITKENPSSKFGFPPGVAEQTVKHTYLKWQQLATTHNTPSSKEGLEDVVIHEEEVVTSQVTVTEELNSDIEPSKQEDNTGCRKEDLESEIYNGAHCGHYWWSQTFQEVDIKIPVEKNITKSRDVKVNIQSQKLTVQTKGKDNQWNTLLDDTLSFNHNKEESIWTLLPGKQVTVHLEKTKEIWWDSLFDTESKLDMSRLDLSRNVTELPVEDQMQVEKVMAQEERKRLELPSIEHQKKLEMLKKAWNQEGSPFQGTHFDPTILQYSPP